MAEPMDPFSADALRLLGSRIKIKPHPIDEKHVFTFQVNVKEFDSEVTQPYFQLSVMKGSVFTYVWSTFARFDDEYALYFCSGNEKQLLWHVKGVDALNAKIGNAEVDWFRMQTVQTLMDIGGVNLLVFSKLLGRLLLSLPYFIRTGQYIAPMPASFMLKH